MSKYHLRRKEKAIIDEPTIQAILKQGQFTTIALCRDNEPYAVTLNYGYDNNRSALYFHCANEGLKLDFIKANNKACASIIEDRGYLSGECNHSYRTLILWGNMRIIDELDEKKHAIDVMLHHLENEEYIQDKKVKISDEKYRSVGILRFDIIEITGKQGD